MQKLATQFRAVGRKVMLDNKVVSNGPLAPVVNFIFFSRFVAGKSVKDIAREAMKDDALSDMHPDQFDRLDKWLQWWQEKDKIVNGEPIAVYMPKAQDELERLRGPL